MWMSITLAVVAIIFTPNVQSQELIYEDRPQWSFMTYLGEDFMLSCNDSVAMLSSTDEIRWMLPNKDIVHGWSQRNTSKLELLTDNGLRGGILKIKNVQESDSGLYYCHVYRNQMMYRKINRGLNMRGHKEREHFEMYRWNVIIGFSAAAVFLFLIAGSCCIVYYQYETDDEKRDRKAKQKYYSDLHASILNGEYNPKASKYVYENDGMELNTHL